MLACSGCFVCEQCEVAELRCGPCGRSRFCPGCAKDRAARSTKKSAEQYRRTEGGRARHRARSLAYYHRRGKELRRQRRAESAAADKAAAAQVEQRADEAAFDETNSRDVSRNLESIPRSDCLTQKRVGEIASDCATVQPAQAVSSMQMPTNRGAREAIDGMDPSPGIRHEAGRAEIEAVGDVEVVRDDLARSGSGLGAAVVVTTVAQVHAAIAKASKAGVEDVVVWGVCSQCGRRGRVVHFDGVLRARGHPPG